MDRSRIPSLTLFVCALLAPAPPARAQVPDPPTIEATLEGLEWRSIGPAEMGGRTTVVLGIPGDRRTIYWATATGGLFLTRNGGATWTPILEDEGTLSIGALAIAPSDRNVLYLGTGENNPRNSTSIGDGVYRSTDGGDSWTHIGLRDSERIGRIRVHPDDPDVVWVAAMGHLWGANEERGLYRSMDGGENWERTLFVDENTGAVDLAMHPSNPRILYAATWDYRRRPWHFRSGGPGSGLYRSKDGGTTWTKLTDAALDNGLPFGMLGRIGLATSPADPDVVYAIIESEERDVLWRSDDAGESWRAVSRERSVGGRPFYYSDVRADPSNADRLYALAGGLSRSIDGGRTWERIARNIHGDHHAFWIDPTDPDRLINGNDGGLHLSYDRGETWEHANTIPLAQFYQIGVDTGEPYRVCGGLQDNDAWCGPSATRNVAGPIQNYWHEILGPGDGMYTQIDPTNPDIIYVNTQGGNLSRVNLATGEARSIRPYPVSLGGVAASEHPYRFNWNAPVHMSPHDPETVYFGGNVLFRTRDGGQRWEEISPDLTRAEPEKLESSGGPITPDNTTAEIHATIFTIAESPVEAGLIWVGTDDGNLHVTRDGGANWTELTDRLAGLPEERWISRVSASHASGGTAYVAVDRHRSDDMAPYIFKTTDYGESWTDITGDLPTPGYAYVIREDPRNPDLVYAGTELGVWASWTGGGNWVSLRLGLPPVSIRDLLVHPRDNDLVIGTHGRGVYVLDDIGPLQQLPDALAAEVHLFEPRPAVRYEPAIRRFRFDLGDRVFAAPNPPYGALLSFHLTGDPPAEADTAAAADTAAVADSVRIHIVDVAGDTVRTLAAADTAGGFRRLAWDLREQPLPRPENGVFTTGLTPPRVLPGLYSVTLTARGLESEAGLEVRLDDRLGTSTAELGAQRDALRRLFTVGEEGIEIVRGIDRITGQLGEWVDRLGEAAEHADLADSAKALRDTLTELRSRLAPEEGGFGGGPALLSRISGLMRSIGGATTAPTAAQLDYADRFAARMEELDVRYAGLVGDPLARLNRELEATGLGHVTP